MKRMEYKIQKAKRRTDFPIRKNPDIEDREAFLLHKIKIDKQVLDITCTRSQMKIQNQNISLGSLELERVKKKNLRKQNTTGYFACQTKLEKKSYC